MPNVYGTVSVSILAQDSGGVAFDGLDTSNATNLTIDIQPVNNAPHFRLNLTYNLCGCQKHANSILVFQNGLDVKVVDGFAYNISEGDPMEYWQSLSFDVVVTSQDIQGNSSLFTMPPTINSAGQLSFQLSQDAHGRAIVNVTLVDSGGTERGGTNRSAVQAFWIDAVFVNQAPIFGIPPNCLR